MDETNFTTSKTKTEAEVIKFYDTYAMTWDSRFGYSNSDYHFLNRRWKSFLEMLDDDLINGHAVELGVGTGIYIDRSAQLFKSITAVDGSPNMLLKLNENIRKYQISNVSAYNADVTNLSSIIKADSVDIVYFFGLLEHIIDKDSFVKEIFRILRKGGVVIGITPNGKSPWYAVRRFFRNTGKHCSSDRYYTSNEIEALFHNNGFSKGSFIFWGAVPAGIINQTLLRILEALEPVLEKTLISHFLGGITFKFIK